MYRNKSRHIGKHCEKVWSQQIEYKQFPNGTGPGVRKSERPLSAYHPRRERSIKKPLLIQQKVEFCINCDSTREPGR